MAANKTLLYVGTYTGSNLEQIRDGHVKPKHGNIGIQIYDMTKTNNGVRFFEIGASRAINASFLTITNNKKYLYAVSEVENECDSQIHCYEIQEDGTLKCIQSVHCEGTVACFIVTDSHDKFAYVANYVGGTAAAFRISPDGTLTVASVVKYTGTSGVVPNRQEGPHIHTIRLSVDEKHIYIADLGNDRIVKLNYDPITGFNPNSAEFYNVSPGSGPRHLAFHPNGRYLYVANELANTVVVFKINDIDGSLTEVQTISTLPSTFKGESYVAEIMITKDGKYLYVSNRGHDSLAMFEVSTDGATLTLRDHQSTNGKWPRNFNIVDDVLLAANQESNNVVPFKISQDGNLTEIGDSFACFQPVCLKLLKKP